ncbi:MAG: SHOCT domain-containing protein [Actinobacteria bacterium]|nr:SHOCT domain-containing protein [Actinomycetota bacterium]
MAIIADAWNMHGDVGTGGWILMVIAMLLFWGALVTLVVWLVRGGASGASAAENPQGILDRRLASGEITPDEYEERRRIISGTSTAEG